MSDKSLLIKDEELNTKIDPIVLKTFGQIQTFFNGRAFLAGGYLRDLKFGQKYHDIDIFIETNKKLFLSNFVEDEVFKVLDLEDEDGVEFKDHQFHDRSYPNPLSIVDVIKQKKKFQLIFLAGLKFLSQFEKFNFNINQIFFNGKHIYYTPNFEQALTKKTVFCVSPPQNYAQYRNYVRKEMGLKKKYPQLKFQPIPGADEFKNKEKFATYYWNTPTSTNTIFLDDLDNAR